MKKGEGLVQFIKFGIVGVANTAVDWVVFFLLTAYLFTEKDGEPAAKAIAFVVAVLNSFIWNTVWTFRKEFKDVVGSKKQIFEKGTGVFLKFFIVSLIGWGVNYYSFKYSRFNLDQSQLISLIAASGAATLWNFFANKLWTYRKTA
jgi:putative flippase GtrA